MSVHWVKIILIFLGVVSSLRCLVVYLYKEKRERERENRKWKLVIIGHKITKPAQDNDDTNQSNNVQNDSLKLSHIYHGILGIKGIVDTCVVQGNSTGLRIITQ